MPSPFPGMDPYVEPRWGSFHTGLIAAFMAMLNGSLPADLEARTEESVRVEDLAGEQLRGYKPDLDVVELPGENGPTRTAACGAAVAEPIRVRRHHGPIVTRNIHIVDPRDGGRIVTAIELLSPRNKLSGRLNRDYRHKLKTYEDGGANWVEVDLLRSSRARLPVRWDAIPAGRRAAYMVVIYRAADDEVGVVPVSIRDPLPAIGVPLREADDDCRLDLQAAFERVYAEGPFRRLDYARPADPPLSAADVAWAAEVVRSAGRGGPVAAGP